MPRVITKARPVAAIGREYSANQRRILVCTWNVKSGMSAGVERMKTRVWRDRSLISKNDQSPLISKEKAISPSDINFFFTILVLFLVD